MGIDARTPGEEDARPGGSMDRSLRWDSKRLGFDDVLEKHKRPCALSPQGLRLETTIFDSY